MTLVLAIKCITPSSAFKDYIFKINNKQLSIPIEIQNKFIHNYQYVYKLWPCQPAQVHPLTIELIEKIGQSQKQIGKVQGKIICSYTGDMYRMHGMIENDEIVLMKFIIEDEKSQSGREEGELKRINKQMEQNLQKYRKEIQGYQEFLYFTNNVIKELNHDDPTSETKPVLLESIQEENLSHLNKLQNVNKSTKENILSPSLQQSFNNTQQSLKRKNKKRMITPQQQMKQSTIIQIQRQEQFSHNIQSEQQTHVSNRVSQVKTFINKYPYLQQQYYKDEELQTNRHQVKQANTGKNTPINKLKQQEDQILSTQPKRSNQISILIKKRRQQYLLPKQANFEISQKDRLSKKSYTTNKKYENKNFHISSLQVNMDKQINIPQVNNPQGKSTRSQTGLKQVKNIKNKSIVQDKPYENVQTIQSNNSFNQKQYIQSPLSNNQPNKTFSKSIQSVFKTLTEKQFNKNSLSSREISIQQSINKISRRKKYIMQKESDLSARYTTQEIKPIFTNQSTPLPNETLVDKLIIFNIHSLFYTNFKSSIKKCIIQHNHQIYQTQHQQNSLKQTSWSNDRIILSPISPFEQIIFQIYSLKRQKMELEGSSMIQMSKIVGNKDKTLKFYLYFEDIAVGYIKFDIEKQVKSYKRLTVSLPQIKQKSTFHEFEPKTSKTVKISKANYLTQASYPINRQNHQSMININDSKEQQKQLNYEDLTSKIRNLKLQRKNRLK